MWEKLPTPIPLDEAELKGLFTLKEKQSSVSCLRLQPRDATRR